MTGDGTPLLELRGLTKEFRSGGLLGGRSVVTAVDDVSLTLNPGEALGLVGESGSGKTTVGRLIVRLLEPSAGEIRVRGRDVAGLAGNDLLAYRRQVQMIFQNSQTSLNPRRRLRSILADAYQIHGLASGDELERRTADLLERVGLSTSMLDRYPHQFSGGQRQRIGIARALSVDPALVVADEPVSALDVSVQAQVLNLFSELRRDLGLALVFISHDLRAVYFLCERVAVLYLGRLVEVAPRRVLLERPAHPYTRALTTSIPAFQPGGGLTRQVIRGEIGDAGPAGGCNFAPRCELWRSLGEPARCRTERPALRDLGGGVAAACHFAEDGMDATAAMADAPTDIRGLTHHGGR